MSIERKTGEWAARVLWIGGTYLESRFPDEQSAWDWAGPLARRLVELDPNGLYMPDVARYTFAD